MFTKITPKADSLLSNEDVANLIVNDALAKISQLTGLNKNQSYALLAAQLIDSNASIKPTKERPSRVDIALLDQNEMQFITQLFH